jgi:crossover junction endodeoxyribonuclease RusA
LLPFEFTVPGPPLSQRAKNRQRLAAWRQTVLAAALARWPPADPTLNIPIRITVVYYHEGEKIRLDGDNMLKPIQDAMNGRIYLDDRLIVSATVSKTPVDGAYRVRRMSQVVVDAFVRGDEFIHVRIDGTAGNEAQP